jgi:DNA-binding HxlR family transcriptional regulator
MFLIALTPRELASWNGADGAERQMRAVISRRDISAGRKISMNAMQGPKTASYIFIGRWTPRILFSLTDRPYRHGQLRRELGSVSQRMLTRTLRNLESAGLVARRVTRSKAVSVEYSLTNLGRSIITPLRGMCRWAQRYRRIVAAGVHFPKTQELTTESKGE